MYSIGVISVYASILEIKKLWTDISKVNVQSKNSYVR